MADTTTLAAIVAIATVAKPAMQTGCNLIEKLLGEPCKVAGGLIADEIYFWQWKNRLRIAATASEILQRNKIAARVIPKGFLLPLIGAAGNVEQPDLQELWAQLLASAVTADEFQQPCLGEILKQLTLDEAKIVRYMANGQNFPLVSVDKRHKVDRHGQQVEVVSWVLRYFSLLPYQAGCDLPDLGPVYIQNLCRLGIGMIPVWVPGSTEAAIMSPIEIYSELENHQTIKALRATVDATPGEQSLVAHGVIRITPLGRQFMKACIAPI